MSEPMTPCACITGHDRMVCVGWCKRTACRQCGAVVEPERECYATPVCYECLPPPRPLVRVCTCLGTCKGAEGLAPGWRCAMKPKEQQ